MVIDGDSFISYHISSDFLGDLCVIKRMVGCRPDNHTRQQSAEIAGCSSFSDRKKRFFDLYERRAVVVMAVEDSF